MTRLAVVIVNWNAERYLRAALASLPWSREGLSVWVVDNAPATRAAPWCAPSFRAPG